MRCSRKRADPRAPRRCAALLVAAFVAAAGCRFVPESAGGSLAVVELEIVSGQEASRLSATLDHRLSAAVRDALHNGVSLTFAWELELRETRDWLWDPIVWRAGGSREVSYRSLSRRYTVTAASDAAASYPDVERTLAALARLDVVVALSRAELDAAARPYFRFRTRLDTTALPPPLRLPSYLSAAWRLDSGWRLLAPGVAAVPGPL